MMFIGLTINGDKIKYMVATRNSLRIRPLDIGTTQIKLYLILCGNKICIGHTIKNVRFTLLNRKKCFFFLKQ